MQELRLNWEPINNTPLQVVERHIRHYMMGRKNDGVTIMSNGTLMFTYNGPDNVQDAKRAMNEAKFLLDFSVTEMKNGPYLIEFHLLNNLHDECKKL